ncbi:MAG: methyltransferase domain-containing protein [Erythrobacter sp.]|nr:MAG: methyltransferase domain-containing protein [Erythrobacter sp.]
MRKALPIIAALVATLALFFGAAFGFDASAVRVALGITPPLDVPYVTTRSAMVDAMLDMAQVAEGDHVIDLGTGDGRILLAAARDRGAGGLGVDLDPTLIEDAREEAERLGLSERVTFREQDLFATPLAEADVVTMFLLPEVNLRLRPRLLAELRPGARVVSNRFDMGDWRADEIRRVSGYNAYLWVVPAQVAGEWRLEVDGQAVPLVLEQRYQEVSGTATVAGEVRPIAAVLRGGELRFSFELDGERRAFAGVVAGERLVPADGAAWQAALVSE